MMSESDLKIAKLLKHLREKKKIEACPITKDVTMEVLLRESTVNRLKDLSGSIKSNNASMNYDDLIVGLLNYYGGNKGKEML